MTIVDILSPKSKKLHHINLQSSIVTLYGRDIWTKIRNLEKTRIKIQRREADLSFLKQCRHSNYIPAFARIKHKLHKHKEFERLSGSLIRHEIHRTRFWLDHLSTKAYKIHLKLAMIIRKDLWSTIDATVALKAEREGGRTQDEQNRKLKKLSNKSKPWQDHIDLQPNDATYTPSAIQNPIYS